MDDDLYVLAFPPPSETPVSADEAGAAVKKFWTTARVRDIQPIPLRTVTRQPSGFTRPHPESLLRAAGPYETAPVRAPAILPRRAATMAGVSAADTKLVDDMTVAPFAVVCKMRMSFGGSGFQGSAWVIGKKAVLTAGHCVYDGGWGQNIQFMPQHKNGQTIGTWTAVQTTALKEFVENDDLRFDIAACILDRDIGSVTGWPGGR